MALEYNKRLYSITESYGFMYEAFRTMPYLKKAKRKGLIDQQFIEKIMLAVTEVNGCQICSYYHTSEALKSGMSEEEIGSMLSGSIDNIAEEESIAILFAQHYADRHAIPEPEAWQRVVDAYGNEKALGILGSIRAIMMGNTLGIGYGAFKQRLKGEPVKGSNLFYELGIMLTIIPFVPIALFHAWMGNTLKNPLIRFS